VTRRAIFIVAGVALLAAVIAYWFLLFSPLQQDIADRETRIEAERQQLSVLQAKLAQLSQMKEEAARNEARLLELAKMVPDSPELPSLILQIQDLAAEAGIDFMTITPGEATPAAAFQVIPLQLQFTGSFFDVNDFIYRAEQLAAAPGRLLAVQTVSLALSGAPTSTTASPKLAVTMTANAFQRNPALEPQPAAAAPAAQPATTE
jgi:Tfp pilus assembly protein PilO